MSAPQLLYQADNHLNGPIEVDGTLFVASLKGDIIGWKNEQQKIEFSLPGQPTSVAYDKKNNVYFIADMARQSILKRTLDENEQDLSELICEYEGMPLLGPHSIIYTNNAIFFTDSGPFGETAIDNCKGSLLMADLENLIAKPIALYCLSYPTGLCIGNDEKTIYLCETGKNRVLRFVQGNANIYYFSVYIQFQGRYGPIACAISPNEHLYVARFEFQQVTEDGLISVYNQNGVNIENIILPSYPELSGLCFSNVKPGVLYVTENSNKGKCLRLQVNQNEKKDKDRFK